MVTRGRRTGMATMGVLAGLALASCAGDAVVVPTDETPFLYLVLGEPAATHGPSDDGHALLLTLASAAEAARYLTADRFDMRDEDGARRFAWENTGLAGTVPSFPAVSFREADRNYRLPAGSDAGTGAADFERARPTISRSRPMERSSRVRRRGRGARARGSRRPRTPARSRGRPCRAQRGTASSPIPTPGWSPTPFSPCPPTRPGSGSTRSTATCGTT